MSQKFHAGQRVYFKHWYNGEPVYCYVKKYIKQLNSYLVEIPAIYNKQENELYPAELKLKGE